MQIRQLKALHAVISTGTTTQAADLLNVTQPAISTMINNLEEELGFVLFERARGRLVPTPEALWLYEEAERTISSFSRVGEVARDLRDLRRGQLKIACLPGPAIEFLPRVMAEFLRDKPHLTASLQIRPSDKVKEWISSHYLDLGIAELPIDDPAVEYEVLAMRCVCVMSETHPLAEKSSLTPADLDGVPVISLNRDHVTFFRISSAFEAAGAKLNTRIEAQLFAPACIFAAEGLGVALVDPISAKAHAGRGIAIRPFHPAIPFDIGLMYPAHRPRSRLVKAFVGLLKTRLSEILASFECLDGLS